MLESEDIKMRNRKLEVGTRQAEVEHEKQK